MPRFTVKFTQRTVGWHNLGGVDLWVMRQDILPPGLLVQLLEVDEDELVVL